MVSRSSTDRNRILKLLPDAELEAMAADLHVVRFALNETVHEQGAGIHHVYFPTEASFSILKQLSGGLAIEVATVGREGMAGIAATLDAQTHPDKTIAQIPGESYCMPIDRFRDHYRRRNAFRRILARFAQLLAYSMTQAIACNRFHPIDQRCAKWLLMTNDRSGNTFPMTHEFLALMLGVNRPTLSLAASTLQNAGLIAYSRGVMTVLDRPGLEAASCECYASIAAELDRLLPS